MRYVITFCLIRSCTTEIQASSLSEAIEKLQTEGYGDDYDINSEQIQDVRILSEEENE